MKQFLLSLPWHDIVDWLGTVGVPALIVLWRKAAKSSSTANKMVEAMISGIEAARPTTGESHTTFTKRAIRDASVAAGVDKQLDAKVAEVTNSPNPPSSETKG